MFMEYTTTPISRAQVPYFDCAAQARRAHYILKEGIETSSSFKKVISAIWKRFRRGNNVLTVYIGCIEIFLGLYLIQHVRKAKINR